MSTRFEIKPLEERIAPSLLGLLGGEGGGGGDNSMTHDTTSVGNHTANPDISDTGHVSVGDVNFGGIGNNLGAGNTIGNNVGQLSDVANNVGHFTDIGQFGDIGNLSDVGHLTDVGHITDVGHVTDNLTDLQTDIIDDVTSVLDSSSQD